MKQNVKSTTFAPQLYSNFVKKKDHEKLFF